MTSEELGHAFQVEFRKGIVKDKLPKMRVQRYHKLGDTAAYRTIGNYPLIGLIFKTDGNPKHITILGYAETKDAPLQKLTENQLQICRSVAEDFPEFYYDGKPLYLK